MSFNKYLDIKMWHIYRMECKKVLKKNKIMKCPNKLMYLEKFILEQVVTQPLKTNSASFISSVVPRAKTSDVNIQSEVATEIMKVKGL